MPSPSELNKRILICARARETPNRPHGGQGGAGQLPNEVLEATSHPGVYLVPVPTSAMLAEAQRHHHSADDSGDARPVQLHLEFITLACQRSGDSSDTMNATNQESNGYRSDARGGVTRGTVLVPQELRSPAAVPTGRWTHVCCSYEAPTTSNANSAGNAASSERPRMQLFIDGERVAGRHTDGEAPQVLGNEMIVGRVLHHTVHETSINGRGSVDKPSLKGAIADLSWHRRPFKPGQLDVLVQCGVRSQREEHHAEVGHYCVRLVSLFQALAGTERGAKFLATSSWMFLLLQLVQVSGATAQRVTLRLFRILMVSAQPATFLSPSAAGATASSAGPDKEMNNSAGGANASGLAGSGAKRTRHRNVARAVAQRWLSSTTCAAC